MKAIIVCVDYSDFLGITLPYNRHHFSDVLVVTAPRDKATIGLCEQMGVRFYATDSFYDDGADFNKWKALERGLDVLGREGWLCIMDADVLWPKHLNLIEMDNNFSARGKATGVIACPVTTLERGNLYTPFRRMMVDMSAPIPQEPYWLQYPRHRIVNDFSGYTQIFHATDSVLGEAPWHQIDWKHAGGADTYFQAKWPEAKKIRPSWECLHLGTPGTNWCGRTTPMLDGSTTEHATARLDRLMGYMAGRRVSGTYEAEKLGS